MTSGEDNGWGAARIGGRRRLPNRRTHQVVTFSLGGFAYSCGVDRHPDNRIGEIFIDASAKSGTAVAAAAHDSAIVASLAIQLGVPLEVIRHAVLRNERDQAVGPLGKLLDLLNGGGVVVNTTPLSRLPIASIIIGKRHRRDLGDIAGLARDIEQNGLFHPVVVTPSGNLIAGERRIAAYKHLGRADIEVTVIDLDDIRRGELAENVHRKDFLPSEIEAIRRAVAPAVATPVGRPAKETTETFGNKPRGETTAKVGAFAGISGRTVEKIAAVVAAAEREPERFGKLVADMDRTRRVNSPYMRLKVARQAESIRLEPPPFPGNSPHRVGAIDVPWPYDVDSEDPSLRATHPYPQMSLAQIRALPISRLMHEDAIIWLWTTNFHMPYAFGLLEPWGFKPRTILTWVKDRPGRGDWLRGQTEHCIMAVRGKPVVTLTDQTTVLFAPLRANSQKPDEFYALVERLCPAPRYLELFSRQPRPGWDGHGDEAGS